MPERRRPRTRRRPDPLHAIPISLETYTKSHPAPAPPFGPAPQLCSPSASAASHPKQRRGAPYHEPLQPGQTSRPTPPPSHFPPPSFFSAGTHHPFLRFCGVEADSKLQPVPGDGEGKWRSGGGARRRSSLIKDRGRIITNAGVFM
ncbi:hypothetical protein VPH35_129536 [Triticum aestivum]